ncbi:MAG: VPLPA-CTERM sorting domain-containing protein, partial [Pseudomonadota bacterium]
NQNGEVTVDLTGLNVTGSFFKFVSTANPRALGKPDGGVRITSLTVEAVPVPAALPLMAAGIGGLSLMGRRRKRAHA